MEPDIMETSICRIHKNNFHLINKQIFFFKPNLYINKDVLGKFDYAILGSYNWSL